MRILFCNTGWMEHYNGTTDDDRLQFGGKYVEETDHGGEQHNFAYHNGYYYGYVNTGSTKGVSNQMRIERIHGGYTSYNEAQDVLVIWTARDSRNGVKIVGWYKEATVFRYYEEFTTIDLFRPNIIYNVKAKAENCTLLPVNKRTFNVPRASVSQDGVGMGQSNIWYADKKEARDFVNSVVEYIEAYNGSRLNLIVRQEELEKETGDSLVTSKEYLEKAYELLNNYQDIEAIHYCNKVLRDEPNNAEANTCKGNALLNLGMFNEAIKYYNSALEMDEDALYLYFNLGLAYGFRGDNEKALVNFNKVLAKEEDGKTLAFKSIALLNLNKVEEGKEAILRAKEIAPDIEWFDYMVGIYDSI